MFGFLKRFTPVEIANILWIRGVSDSSVTRVLSGAGLVEQSDCGPGEEEPSQAVIDETVYFLSFVIDMNIYKVFRNDKKRHHALRGV